MKKTREVKTIKSFSVPVYTLEGVQKEPFAVTLAQEETGVNKTLLAQYVRVYSLNQRQGNAATKTRAEVKGTTKKIYKQKGTGKARHGSMKAPIFKGGGVVGGPQPKQYSLTLSKKQKIKALYQAFLYHALQKTIIGLEEKSLEGMNIKTRLVVNLITKTKLTNKKILFILLDSKLKNFIYSARNISHVVVTHIGQINVVDLLHADILVVTTDALQKLASTSI